MKRKLRDPRHRKWEARQRRVRRRLMKAERPRLTIFRSTRHIYAQIDDLHSGRTLGTISTRSSSSPRTAEGKLEAARWVGTQVADVARQQGIQKVVFNRNGFLYHGRVKALAEAAREAGLEF